MEVDYGALEVRIAACYHKDPTMMDYIRTGHDLHEDMAVECFLLPQDQVTKETRFQAKSSFVFAEFYGDYYISVAQALWEAFDRHKLTTSDGVTLKKHLRQHGIHELGDCNPDNAPRPNTFEQHIKDVEDRFWGDRFSIYAGWKRAWWDAYNDAGGFDMLTGFHVEGVYRRNQVINYPVQGAAFHCLLWSLIQLQRKLRRHRMRSVIIGQIHDSIVLDVHCDEFDDVIGWAKMITVDRLRKAWPWIIVPLEVDFEAAPPGGSWYDKKEIAV